MKSILKSSVAAAALALTAGAATTPAIAQLIDVTGVVESVYPGPGGDLVAQIEWGVRNLTTDTTVSVLLNGYIVYANNLRQQAFPPEELNLGPGEGTVKLAFVIVPRQAGSGTATFHAEGRVQRVAGGANTGSGTLVTDTDTFEVP